MERVLIIGSGGAGKTTLARSLAVATGLPLIHLDRLYWHPGWVETPAEEWHRVVQNAVAGERWIIDGNYGETMALRLAAADTAVFLDLPRSRCLVRAVKRLVSHRGRTRADMAPGCPERITWEYIRWIWGYPTTGRPAVVSKLQEFESAGRRVVVLRNAIEARRFLASISPP